MNSLTEIFDRSGKSTGEICKASGIEQGRIAELTSGAEPNLSELRDLASALGISLSEFLPVTGRRHDIALLFRQTMTNLKPSQVPLVETLSEKIERTLELIGSSPGLAWSEQFEGSHSSVDDAVKDAAHFREVFFNGDIVEPFLNLPEVVVHSAGAILSVMPLQRVDGASAAVDGVPFLFVSRRPPPRMLFTVAHELGHFVAHHPLRENFALLDPVNLFGGIRNPRSPVERYSDAFASNLLLPARGVGIALKKIREKHPSYQHAASDIELFCLSRLFGVSFQVAARRCEALDLLPSGGALSMYEEIRKQYGSPEKRADELDLPPRTEITFPTVSRQVLEGAIKKIAAGQVSIGRAAESMGISIESIVERHRGMADGP